MKKSKTPRGKVRGKNMKKIFACLLSLSMIPANGVAVFATQKRAGTVSEQKNTTLKKQANDTEQSQIKFAQESLTSKIGCFKLYEFEGIDQDDIQDITFDNENPECGYIYYDSDYVNGEYKKGYKIVSEKAGSMKVTAHITKTNGEEVTVGATEIKIVDNDEDVVPITSSSLFWNIRRALELPNDSTTYITKEQIKKLKKLDASYSGNDINGIEDAINCEELNLSCSYDLDDISKLAQLTNLKKINLCNTSVRNIEALTGLKNLTYVNLNNTKVSTEDRFSLFKTDKVSIEEGTEVADLLNPKGLVQTADTITSSDPSVVSVKQEKKSDGTSEWVFKAEEGTEGKDAVLTIQNDTQKKQIPIHVVAKESATPDFAEKTVETNIGCFKEIQLKNADIEDAQIEFSSSNEDVLNVVTDEGYDNGEYVKKYRLEPKAVGEATVTGYIEKADGTKYKRTMKVTVQKEESNVVPIKRMKIFDSIRNDWDSEQITWDDLKEKTYIDLSIDYIQDNKDMEWLSGAENCQILDLSNNYELSDIASLSELKN